MWPPRLPGSGTPRGEGPRFSRTSVGLSVTPGSSLEPEVDPPGGLTFRGPDPLPLSIVNDSRDSVRV